VLCVDEATPLAGNFLKAWVFLLKVGTTMKYGYVPTRLQYFVDFVFVRCAAARTMHGRAREADINR
jgi:hypothetical protein